MAEPVTELPLATGSDTAAAAAVGQAADGELEEAAHVSGEQPGGDDGGESSDSSMESF